MKTIETLTGEYYCEEKGEVWVPNLSKYTKWEDDFETPYSELYLAPTGTSILKRFGPLAEPIPYIIFEILKEIENPHLVKLQRRFYCRFKEADIKRLQTNPATVPIDAYTRMPVREGKIEILKRQKEYLLENISSLQELFDCLSQKRVCVNFRRREDVRADSNGLIITNPDAFTMSDDENLTFYNRLTLLNSISALAMQEYSEQLFRQNTEEANKAISDLFDSQLARETDIAIAVEKKLSNVRKPMNYVKKYR